MDLVTVGGTLLLLIIIAFIVETLTEFVFGTVFDHIPALTPYKWVQQYIAIAVGIIGAYNYQIDLIHEISVILGTNPVQGITPFGLIATGIAVGKGSNYLHQLFSKYLPGK